MMKGLLVLVLLIAAATAVGAETIRRSNKMRVDWDNGYTKEELEAGAFLNPLRSSRTEDHAQTHEQLEAGTLSSPESSHIVGGDVVRRPPKAPYVGSLYAIEDDTWFFACTCSVVDTKIVITAAHCTEWERGVTMGICVSGVVVGDKMMGHCSEVARYKAPKKYFDSDFNKKNPWTHDLALLRTKKKLIQKDSKARILPVDLDDSAITARGAMGFAYGFGNKYEEGNGFDGKLRIVDMSWKKMTLCRDDKFVKGKNFLCADGNYDGSMGGTCFGDSGGPLVWSTDGSEDPEKHVLVGVLSYGYIDEENNILCPATELDAFSRIASVSQTKFLKRAMGKLAGNLTIYKP